MWHALQVWLRTLDNNRKARGKTRTWPRIKILDGVEWLRQCKAARHYVHDDDDDNNNAVAADGAADGDDDDNDDVSAAADDNNDTADMFTFVSVFFTQSLSPTWELTKDGSVPLSSNRMENSLNQTKAIIIISHFVNSMWGILRNSFDWSIPCSLYYFDGTHHFFWITSEIVHPWIPDEIQIIYYMLQCKGVSAKM